MAHGHSQGRKDHRDRTVALCCVALVVVMVGRPLPRSRSTGCSARRRVSPARRSGRCTPPKASIDKTITVRFDANVTPGMPWRFEPVQSTLDVKIGENALAFYRATNLADHAVTGMATFNVTPEPAGAFSTRCNASALLSRCWSPASRSRCR